MIVVVLRGEGCTLFVRCSGASLRHFSSDLENDMGEEIASESVAFCVSLEMISRGFERRLILWVSCGFLVIVRFPRTR